MTGKVYVIQNQHRFDAKSGALVPKWPDLVERASLFGEVVFLLSPGAAPWALDGVTRELHAKLAGFSDEDALLLVGNPILIGVATAIASHYNEGRIRFLQWSGREKMYMVSQGEIFGPPMDNEVVDG